MEVTILIVTGLPVFFLALVRPRWGLYLLLPAVVFSPEFVVGNVEFRRISLRIEDLLFLGVLGGTLLRGQQFQQVLGASRWVWPALAFMYVLIVTTAIGLMVGSTTSIPLSLFFALKLLQYFLFAICAAALISTEEHLEKFVVAMVLTLGGLALWMLFPVFGDDPRASRVALPFDLGATQQSAVLGALAAVMCSSLLLFWRSRRSTLLTAGLLMGLIAGLALLVASGGRAGAIGFAIALLYLVMNTISQRFRVGTLVCVAAFALLAMTAVLWLHNDPRFQQGLERIAVVSSPESLESDESLQSRIAKWRNSLDQWQQRPVLGTGMPAVVWVDNWYLRLLMETGIVGLAVWLWLMWVLYRTASASVAPKGGLVAAYATGLTGAIIVMAAASMFAEYFMTVRTAVPFWLVMGAGLGVIIRQRRAQALELAERRPHTGPETLPAPMGR